jgi:hypothetical protein
MDLIKLDYQNQNKESLECCFKFIKSKSSNNELENNDSEELFVHKMIIQRCSKYFKNYFSKKKKVFIIEYEFNYQIIKNVFDILYNCCDINDVKDNLLEMYIFCDKYLIDYVKKNITDYFINNIDSFNKKYNNNIIDIIKFTNNYDAIIEIINKYIINSQNTTNDLKIEFFLTFKDFLIIKNKLVLINTDNSYIKKLYNHKFISILSYLNYISDFDPNDYNIVELNDDDIIYQIFKKVKCLEKLKELIYILKDNVHDVIKNSINELYQNGIINLYYYLSFHTDKKLDNSLNDTDLLIQTFDYLEETDKGHLIASIIIKICKSSNIEILPQLDKYKEGLKSIIRWYSYMDCERIYTTLYNNNKITSDTFLERRL